MTALGYNVQPFINQSIFMFNVKYRQFISASATEKSRQRITITSNNFDITGRKKKYNF